MLDSADIIPVVYGQYDTSVSTADPELKLVYRVLGMLDGLVSEVMKVKLRRFIVQSQVCHMLSLL